MGLGCCAAVILPLLTGCQPRAPQRLNLIMVLVDTLRADHMSAYGYARQTTPFLDAFFSEGIVFERARSQSACTYPSVNSLLTSRYPFSFYRRSDPQDLSIPADLPTLAEVLAAQGYSTLAVSASPIVRATPDEHNPVGGFDSGYSIFDESCLFKDASCVNSRAFELLGDAPQEPFFLYAHYMDPHGPYLPPPTHPRRFAGAYDGAEFIANGNVTPLKDEETRAAAQAMISERDIHHLIDLYDEEISYLDSQLATLFGWLDRRGLLDRSLVILVADHGEELTDHTLYGHCNGVWDSLTRTPLYLRWPDGPRGRRIDAAVQNLDVMPTVLDILGIASTELGLEGTSLLPRIHNDLNDQRFSFADYGRYRSVDDGRFKLVYDGISAKATLYDLRTDPGEQEDLYRPDHPEAQRLGHALNEWLRSSGQWQHFEQALEAAQENQEQLRALGYVW